MNEDLRYQWEDKSLAALYEKVALWFRALRPADCIYEIKVSYGEL